MVGSRDWETIQVFHDALQAAVARITPAILLREGPFLPGERTGRLHLSDARAALGASASGYTISIAMRFRLQPSSLGGNRWKIQTFAYAYLLSRDERQIVGYHWDAEASTAGAVRSPHVHFGKELSYPGLPREDRDRLGTLAAAHMPTGHIPFTWILRAAIRDFGVEPIRLHGETIDEARKKADRAFAVAESVPLESFEWSRGQGAAIE